MGLTPLFLDMCLCFFKYDGNNIFTCRTLSDDEVELALHSP